MSWPYNLFFQNLRQGMSWQCQHYMWPTHALEFISCVLLKKHKLDECLKIFVNWQQNISSWSGSPPYFSKVWVSQNTTLMLTTRIRKGYPQSACKRIEYTTYAFFCNESKQQCCLNSSQNLGTLIVLKTGIASTCHVEALPAENVRYLPSALSV